MMEYSNEIFLNQAHLNINSLRNKLTDISNLIDQYNLDVFCICETKLESRIDKKSLYGLPDTQCTGKTEINMVVVSQFISKIFIIPNYMIHHTCSFVNLYF